MGYSPTLENEALQGLESLCNGRWGCEGRSSRSEWTEMWCETGLWVSLTNQYPAVLCAAEIEILS